MAAFYLNFLNYMLYYEKYGNREIVFSKMRRVLHELSA